MLGLGTVQKMLTPVPLKQYQYQSSTSFDTYCNFIQY